MRRANKQRQYVKVRQVGPARSAKLAAATRAIRQVAYAATRPQAVPRHRVGLGYTSGPRDEKKTFDAIASVTMEAANDLAPATTPFAPIAGTNAGCINQVGQGNTSITRIGRKLRMKSVAIRGTLYAGGAGTTARAAMILVYQREPNEKTTLPSWTELLTSETPNALTSINGASKYKIVRRWDFAVAGNNDTNNEQIADSSVQVINEFVNLGGLETAWKKEDTTGVYTNMEVGALHLYVVSDKPNTGTQSTSTAPWFTLSTRLYFEDH